MMHRILIFVFLFIGISCKSQEKKVETISELDKQLFTTQDKEVAKKLQKELISYIENFPSDTLSPVFLFRVSEINIGLGDTLKAVQNIETIRKDYPYFDRMPEVIFRQAYIHDMMEKREPAAKLYQEFIQKYPTHKLVPNAQEALLLLQQGDIKNLIDQWKQKDSTSISPK